MAKTIRFGDRLRYFLVLLDVSQQELSRRLNARATTVSAWARNVSTPLHSNLIGIADALGISVDRLMGPIGKVPPKAHADHPKRKRAA